LIYIISKRCDDLIDGRVDRNMEGCVSLALAHARRADDRRRPTRE
jgi:hypothetical protein